MHGLLKNPTEHKGLKRVPTRGIRTPAGHSIFLAGRRYGLHYTDKQTRSPMPSSHTGLTRLLLCSSDKGKLEPLRQRFDAAGITVDCTTTAQETREHLWQQHYDGIAIDLLLADQDGISLAMELREEHPDMPVLVISASGELSHHKNSPGWLTRSTEYARLLFALKQAGQRAAGRPTRILHVEDDDELASLVQNTIGGLTELFRARSVQEAQIAMALRDYDLALIRTGVPQASISWKRDNAGPPPLEIDCNPHNDPVLNILDKLRRPAPFVHEPAWC